MTPAADRRFRRVDSRRLLAWRSFGLDEVDVEGPDGSIFSRRHFHSPGVVAVLALDDTDPEPRIALVNQYRSAHDRWFWEIPAGTRDIEGESSLDCARRELAEEAGLEADHWRHLISIAPATGSSNSVVELWLATGLHHVEARPDGEEESAMVHELVPIGEAWRRIGADPPVNATTAIAIRLLPSVVPDVVQWLD